MDTQAGNQAPRQANGFSTRFPPGKSGNPSGKTKSQARLDEIMAAFRTTFSREPSAVEMISIRSAAKLAAVAGDRRVDGVTATRASNSLARMLRLLGLASPPKQPKRPPPARPSLLAQYLTGGSNGR
jgi:hypothetical protein